MEHDDTEDVLNDINLEKVNKRQNVLIFLASILLIGMVAGLTYAFFNYTKTGAKNTLKVGTIDFSSNYTSVQLTNFFPISRATALSGQGDEATSNTATIVVNVDGITDYDGGVEYLISLAEFHNSVNGKEVPLGLIVSVNDLGDSDSSYFTNRGSTKTYKVLAGDNIIADDKIVVGYIPASDTATHGTITMKVFIDASKIAISDTYDGEASEYNGTTSNWVNGRVVLTTAEWASFFTTPISFKVKMEANEGTWVKEPESFYEVITEAAYARNYSENYLISNVSYKTQDTVATRANNQKRTVYYYNGSDGRANGNVLFAGYCWQFVRTTDDGGIRLIYNGIAENNQCKTDRSGTTWEGVNATSASVDLRSAYLYGTGYTYDLATDKFELTNPDINTSTWSLGTYQDFIGKYTCMNGTGLNCDEVYYVAQYDPSDTTKAYTTQYSIGNVAHYSQMGTSAFNTGYTSLANVGYMYNDLYLWGEGDAASGAIFGTDVEYSNGNYLVVNDTPGTASAYTTLDTTHHYTCGSASTTSCSTVRYYYYTGYYFELSGGEKVGDLLKKMINYKQPGDTIDANINVKNSSIKDYLEIWYDKNLKDYENYLDRDTVYCNNRSVDNLAGWNNDGGNLSAELTFSQNGNTFSLACDNITDRFSMANSHARLKSPIGLLTNVERGLMGDDYAITSSEYWTMSPGTFYYYDAYVRAINTNGTSAIHYVVNDDGVRGVITLRPEVELEAGNGTVTNPYQIGPLVNRVN